MRSSSEVPVLSPSIAHANIIGKCLVAIVTASVCMMVLMRSMLSASEGYYWAVALLAAGQICIFTFDVSEALLASFLPRTRLFLPPKQERTSINEPIWFCVPVIIRRTQDVDAACECIWQNAQLNPSAMLWFIILFDLPDAYAKHTTADEYLRSYASSRVGELNARLQQHHLPSCRHLFRERTYDPIDDLWLGWERKRGKLVEFMRLVSGDTNTSFSCGADQIRATRFLLTLDVDSRLENDGAPRLWSAFMAARETSPELTIFAPSLETPALGRESLFRRLYEPYFRESGWAGPEPTDRQLLSGNDLFYGKGLIDIGRFLNAAAVGIPSNTVLSHDHLEGLLASSASFYGVRLFEPFPTTRLSWEERQHRWVRGDFQLIPWIWKGGPSDVPDKLRARGRAKLTRILLKDLQPLFRWALTMLAVVSITKPGLSAASWLLLAVAFPSVWLMPLSIFRLFHRRARASIHRAHELLEIIGRAIAKAFGELIYLQRDAILSLDAALVTLLRLTRGRRRMLEWHPVRRQRLFIRLRIYESALLVLSSISATHILWLVAWYVVAPLVPSFILVGHKTATERSSRGQCSSFARQAA